MSVLEKIDLARLEFLFEKSIVTRAGLERGHIVNDYIDMKKKDIPVIDIYIKLSQKHNKSEYTIKNIVLNYFREVCL